MPPGPKKYHWILPRLRVVGRWLGCYTFHKCYAGYAKHSLVAADEMFSSMSPSTTILNNLREFLAQFSKQGYKSYVLGLPFREILIETLYNGESEGISDRSLQRDFGDCIVELSHNEQYAEERMLFIVFFLLIPPDVVFNMSPSV